jgi:hypothetical protein
VLHESSVANLTHGSKAAPKVVGDLVILPSIPQVAQDPLDHHHQRHTKESIERNLMLHPSLKSTTKQLFVLPSMKKAMPSKNRVCLSLTDLFSA